MPTLIGKIEPGDVIGRCRVIRELGRGGVGAVYLATHQTLQIEVALKVLSPALSLDNPALAERFIRESQIAARIRHPNVIAVMDAAHDEATGLYFIVMEYVGGGSLSWHLRNGPLPEAKALGVIAGIAQALIVAEENRIVHRDIKPDNIMLDLRGTAKLADLGLAKHAIDSRTSLTLGGSYMGTPAYMSPEQARDAKVADTRDDIYSLGATFYECLTGVPPFQGETPYNIMSEVLTKPSPIPSTLRPEISRASDFICRKMMAKNRELRYANARALAKDLRFAQTLGDSGLDCLEAANFDRDSAQVQQRATTYGIETSADGVAIVPDLPNDSQSGVIHRSLPAHAPYLGNQGVFGAAALLLVLVTISVLLLAWLGPQPPFPVIKKAFTLVTGTSSSTPAPKSEPGGGPVKNPPLPVAHTPSSNPNHNQPPATAPSPIPGPAPVQPAVAANQGSPPGPTQPVMPPVNPVAVPANSTAPPIPSPSPTPAMPVVPASAFEARNIAESGLGNIVTDPTGQAELLKIIGKRDDASTTPTTWTFYFYDKSVSASNARVVTVTDGKVVKNDSVLVDTGHFLPYVLSYSEKDVMPNDKLATDSSQALATAETLLPAGVVPSATQFELVQKDSVPMWKITLWAKNPHGDEEELGTVSVLAEKNILSGYTLKLDSVVAH
ncbi:MAG TPA: protein kinase [Candidatus Methylacidiphilales bacterium]|nr:protein kinase [Candidatus Methylacidiphilales bacterium]